MNNTYYGLYRAETPIQHQADEKMETTSVCRHNTVILSSGKMIKNYNISSASFRNAIRQNIFFRLLELIDIKIEDIPEITNVVFASGGPRLDKTKNAGEKKLAMGHVPIEYSNSVCQWFPQLHLLGCTSRFCMLPHFGSALAPTSLNALIPDLNEFVIEHTILTKHNVDIDTLVSNVTEFQFNVKRDPRIKYDDKKDSKDGTDCGIIANMFDVQYLKKGTLFGNQVFIDDTDNEMLSSCFSAAINIWQRRGGFIAGKKSAGAGVLSCKFEPKLPSAKLWEDFVLANKPKLQEIIMDDEIWKSHVSFEKYGDPNESA